MRLIRLSANKKSFNTIIFNKTGLSIILGRSTAKQAEDNKKTYNGLGKSLAVRLVHFCLGSNRIPEFEEKLKDWEFTLVVEIGGKELSIMRQAVDQRYVYIDGAKTPLKKYRDQLGQQVFGLDQKKKFVSFRNLITHFIRPTKESYLAYDQMYKKERDYSRTLNIGYLLGLDDVLMLKKVELKERQDRTDKLKKNIETDEIFRSYFLDGKDYKSDLYDVREELAQLEPLLAGFRVAKNYEAIQLEADEVNRLLRRQRNRAAMVANTVSLIDDRLARGMGATVQSVVRLYAEAKVILSDSLVRTLDEVQSFHQKLIASRVKRLGEERQRLEREAGRIGKEVRRLSERQDQLVGILNTHGALDEFVALGKKQTALRLRLDKLVAYEEILEKYRTKLSEIKVEFSQQNLAGEAYVQANKGKIDDLAGAFRALTKEFYEDKPGSFSVQNNVGNNRLRFDIAAHIIDDVSDGIGEVRMFCFDWLLLKARTKHSINFLFHDSRLLANMDPRQCASVFRAAFKGTKESDYQYVISLNQNMLEQMSTILRPEEIDQIITKNKVLELTDESDATRLLGIHVDLDYEQEDEEASE